MKKIKPSKLSKRLTFLKPSDVQDSEGNWVTSYQEVFTVWGSIEGSGSLSNPEAVIAGALGVRSSKRITIRVNEGIQRDMRVIHGLRTFEVVDFDYAKNSDSYYEILCDEVNLNG